jgi:hypothetical protein
MPRCAGTKRDGGRCAAIVEGSFCYQHDPDKADERRRNASKGGRSKGGGPELAELKKRVKDLAREVLNGEVDRRRAAVANQLYNTLIRAIEQERKMRELEELAGRIEALEEVLRGRKAG